MERDSYIQGFMDKCAELGVDPAVLARSYPRLQQPWSREQSPIPGGVAYNRAVNPARVLQFDPTSGRYADVTRQVPASRPQPKLTFSPVKGRYTTALGRRGTSGGLAAAG